MRRCKSCGTRIPETQAFCVAHRLAAASHPGSQTPSTIKEEDDEEPCWPRQFSFLQDKFSEAEVIGQGGFATVYRAKRVEDGQMVALKVAHSKFAREKDAMAREVEALLAIGGRGAPRWIESSIGVPDRPDYLVLELLDGSSLAERLATFGRIMIPDALQAVIDGLLSALERVHKCGFVHNDLKPENVFLVHPSRVLLFDYDLTLRQGEAISDVVLDRCLGTAEYMSPERIAGRQSADLRSDIYSLGVMLYELYAGVPPFWGSEVQVRQAHRSRRAPSLKAHLFAHFQGEVSEQERQKIEAIHALVHCCLRKNPARRPTSVAQVRALWEDAKRGKIHHLQPRFDLKYDLAQLGRKAQCRASVTKTSVGVLWIHSGCERAELLLRIRDVGGVLVHCDRDHYVVVCGFQGLVNPVRVSLDAAGRLMNTPDLRMQIVVDIATVFVSYNQQHTPIFLSGLWCTRDRYALSKDGRGLFIRNAAHELVPDLSTDHLEHNRYMEWNSSSVGAVISFVPAYREMVGHQEVLSAIVGHAQRAQRNEPSLSWVFGSPGRGKSYLAMRVHEKLTDLHPYGRHLLWHMSRRASLSARDGFLQLWRALFGQSPARERVGRGQTRFLQESQRENILRLLDTDPNEASNQELHDLVVRAVDDVLTGYCEQNTMVLIVDDAQLLHESLLEALRTMCVRGSVAFAVVLFAQEAQGESEEPSNEGEAVYTLQALNRNQSIQLTRQLLQHVAAVPSELLNWVAKQSAGNPMMITGLVKALSRQGVVHPDPKSQRWEVDCSKLDAMPQSPVGDWLVEREIASWPPELQSFAQWAALMPDGFRCYHLEGVIDKMESEGMKLPFDLHPDYGLVRLCEAKVLVIGDARGYHFHHAVIRRTLLRQLGGDELVHWAGRLSEAPRSPKRKRPRLNACGGVKQIGFFDP